jgi:hypothetical protein
LEGTEGLRSLLKLCRMEETVTKDTGGDWEGKGVRAETSDENTWGMGMGNRGI